MNGSRILTAIVAVTGSLILICGCKSRQVPKVRRPDVVQRSRASKQGAEEKHAEKDTRQGKEVHPLEGKTEGPNPRWSKETLRKAYQEIYCAQKRNEMDKLLDIYKKYGFDSPEAFSTAWIEAAKDREWVSGIANEVAKRCK